MLQNHFAAMPAVKYLFVFGFTIFFVFTSNSANAQVKGWGYNEMGNLGIGISGVPRPTPVTVGSLTDVTSFGGGANHTLALKSNGTVVAWGNNASGQIGNGTVSNSGCLCISTPTVVSGLTGIIQVSAGAEHSLALKADGTVWAWGDNTNGQLGNGTQTAQSTPIQVGVGVSGFNNIVAIDAGGSHNLALKADGTVWSWGVNTRGQVKGDGTTSARVLLPVQVSSLSNIISVSAGDGHSVALGSNGKVRVWGYNLNGQVGTGTRTNMGCFCVSTPTESNIIGVSQIAAGGNHTSVLKQDGTIWAWGFNTNGEIGTGTPGGNILSPSQVTNLSEVVEIETTGLHNIARKRDGTLWAWGFNEYGQVRADGTVGSAVSTPVLIANVGTTEAVFGTSYLTSFVSVPNAPTEIGSNVKITGENVSLTFDFVKANGNTQINLIDPTSQGLSVPAGHKIQQNTIGYNITTDAVFLGNVNVCLAVPSVSSEVLFNSLILYHGENGAWVDRTASRDYRKRQVCGAVSSLSPFAIGRPLFVTSATVTTGGRITSASGKPIARAQITLTSSAGETRTSISNFSGNYRLADVRTGETYIVEIRAKGYQFNAEAVLLNEARNDLNFAALP